jgi:hypothetical protein
METPYVVYLYISILDSKQLGKAGKLSFRVGFMKKI